MTDALAYSTIKNNITGDAMNKLISRAKLAKNNIADDTVKLNSYLDQTAKKRICCLARQGGADAQGAIDSKGIDIRIPVPKGYDFDNDNDKKMHTKFGYIDKRVYIPDSACDKDWTPGSAYCNSFYEIYCSNILDSYIKENDGAYDALEWPAFKPDCSCYGQPDRDMDTLNIARLCYMEGCEKGNAGSVYLDPTSREAKECSVTLCQAITKIPNAQVGRDINYQSNIEQKCGPGANSKADVIGANTNTNTGAGTNTNTGAGTNTNTDANTNTGVNRNTNRGANTNTNTGANTNTDANTNTNTGTNTSGANTSGANANTNANAAAKTAADAAAKTAADAAAKKAADAAAKKADDQSQTNSLNKYFTKEGNYLGFVATGCCVLILLIIMFMVFKQK